MSGQEGVELLPEPPPTCPWQFAEKGEEIWVLGCLDACP